ncbi:Gfo/Idh/MocA family protein [Streptomyces sp. AC495_CC817]|uniref:Gfo/Idh/MocA family protein n=1 Tax=Streptomyces sp. AC495_CC817 TaxID=2823900 RepID=UPI001C26056A|nr:Gfo/Idh/MocA family oxidoreductase [Streptomyces sp. AC495_CC817]
MTTTRWAVLGPGVISGDFATGLRDSRHGVLHAVGSSDRDRAAAFAAERGAAASGTYDEILSRDDVDAVYIGTVHTTHADLAIRALDAGKAVLCEKPITPTAAETDRVLAAAARSGRPFVEAFKQRFGPFAELLRGLIADRELGEPLSLVAAFGYDQSPRTGRAFDPALAGGAILDVGCYPASLAVEVARLAGWGDAPASFGEVDAQWVNGVDADTTARLTIGRLAVELRTAVIREMPGSAVIRCTDGDIVMPDAWGSRTESPSSLILRRGAEESVVTVPVVQPMGAEADAVSLALAEGRVEAPEMTWADSAAIARLCSGWLDAARAAARD